MALLLVPWNCGSRNVNVVDKKKGTSTELGGLTLSMFDTRFGSSK